MTVTAESLVRAAVISINRASTLLTDCSTHCPQHSLLKSCIDFRYRSLATKLDDQITYLIRCTTSGEPLNMRRQWLGFARRLQKEIEVKALGLMVYIDLLREQEQDMTSHPDAQVSADVCRLITRAVVLRVLGSRTYFQEGGLLDLGEEEDRKLRDMIETYMEFDSVTEKDASGVITTDSRSDNANIVVHRGACTDLRNHEYQLADDISTICGSPRGSPPAKRSYKKDMKNPFWHRGSKSGSTAVVSHHAVFTDLGDNDQEPASTNSRRRMRKVLTPGTSELTKSSPDRPRGFRGNQWTKRNENGQLVSEKTGAVFVSDLVDRTIMRQES